MTRWNRKRPKEFDAGADTLNQLLDREQRLAAELQQAKAEAARLLEEARTYATERLAACDAMIEERSALLASSCEQELQAEFQGIATTAALEVKRFEDLGSARTRRLVGLVLETVGALEPQKSATAR